MTSGSGGQFGSAADAAAAWVARRQPWDRWLEGLERTYDSGRTSVPVRHVGLRRVA